MRVTDRIGPVGILACHARRRAAASRRIEEDTANVPDTIFGLGSSTHRRCLLDLHAKGEERCGFGDAKRRDVLDRIEIGKHNELFYAGQRARIHRHRYLGLVLDNTGNGNLDAIVEHHLVGTEELLLHFGPHDRAQRIIARRGGSV